MGQKHEAKNANEAKRSHARGNEKRMRSRTMHVTHSPSERASIRWSSCLLDFDFYCDFLLLLSSLEKTSDQLEKKIDENV